MDNQPDLLDVKQFSFEGSFDEQLDEILRNIRLTRNYVVGLQRLVFDVENGLRKLWPGCRVFPFGSIVTGLGIRTSDVDCYIHVPEQFQSWRSPVVLAKNELSFYPKIFAKLFSIPQASVPILKLYHIPTNRNCDISFKSPSGVENSKLLGYLMNNDVRVLRITILLKYWSKVFKFTGTNLMANYVLTLLCVFYFQIKGILPPIERVQRHMPYYIIDNWNSAFDSEYYHSNTNDESLYDLLGGFFKFYSSFDFDQYIISIYLGQPIKKELFLSLHTVPEEYALYKENVTGNVCKPLRLDSKICVQDPFEHSRNCGVAVFPKLMERIIGYFKHAASLYDVGKPEGFLKAMFIDETGQRIAAPKLNIKIKRKKKNMKNRSNQTIKKTIHNVNQVVKDNKLFLKIKKEPV